MKHTVNQAHACSSETATLCAHERTNAHVDVHEATPEATLEHTCATTAPATHPKTPETTNANTCAYTPATKDTPQRRSRHISRGTMMRLARMCFEFYPVMLVGIVVIIVGNALLTTVPNLFMQQAFVCLEQHWNDGAWMSAAPVIRDITMWLIIVYIITLITNIASTQMCVYFTEGTITKLRKRMFKHMESLPISYFDTHKHGDIMSMYTNDVDAIRQMLLQSLPNLLATLVCMVSLICIMMYYSIPMMSVVCVGVVLNVAATKYIGSKSARYFLAQQRYVGACEGFAQEAMSTLRVVKTFTHEDQTLAAFDAVNNELYEASRKAHLCACLLPPVIFNIGNITYVLVALAGGIALLVHMPNLSLSGSALTLAVVIPFLNMTRQFVGQIGQISNQINATVMGFAGMARIFALLDTPPERDEGSVCLVNTREHCGQIVETNQHTGVWAWKQPTSEGTSQLTALRGEVILDHVNFSYDGEHTVLHDISIVAPAGKKIAFVGATGAGKTTITNLLNRFYDISAGTIRYDGINLTSIQKAALRRSLGIVLQDVHLFTGSVMDNIRYGNLDATDDECIQAAKLTGADSFIVRLPEGYNTQLTAGAAQLSQGQRQLISIARAAVADPPVMILDEATSSIDTHTEEIVQYGMDALMRGRTTFVIAHRLSTVRNADEIIVLDHGRIIERGSHAELLKQKGVYYQLYTGAFELE